MLCTVYAMSGRRRQAIPGVGRLRVSENNRYLVGENGTPFFWLGDTAWELFHRLDGEEATRYLEDRAGKGVTVIQAVVLAERGLAQAIQFAETKISSCFTS